MKLKSFIQHPYLILVLALNLVPFYGIFKLNWSVSEIIILYWWDVGVVAMLALLGSVVILHRHKDDRRLIYREIRPLNIYFIFYTFLSIGLFMLFGKAEVLNYLVSNSVLFMMASFFLLRGVLFLQNFTNYKEDAVGTARDIISLIFPNFLTLFMFATFVVVLVTEDIASVGNIAAYTAVIFLLTVRLVIDLALEKSALNKKNKI